MKNLAKTTAEPSKALQVIISTVRKAEESECVTEISGCQDPFIRNFTEYKRSSNGTKEESYEYQTTKPS